MKEIKNSSGAKVTIVEVAKYAGVVPSTVSHVLNGTAQITDETKAKVLRAIEALHYTPNASARNLRQKRRRPQNLRRRNRPQKKKEISNAGKERTHSLRCGTHVGR